MPIYRVNGDVYDIPEDVASKFEASCPNATVDIYDTETGDVYDMPLSKVSKFKEKFPKWSYDKPVEGGNAPGDTGILMTNYAGGLKGIVDKEAWKPTPVQKAAAIGASKAAVGDFNAKSGAMVDKANNLREYMTHGESIGRQPASAGVRLDRSTGKAEQTYITPSGFRMAGRDMADKEAFAHRRHVDNMTVAGQLRRAGSDLQYLTDKAEKRKAEVIENVRKRQEERDSGAGFLGKIYEGIRGGDGMVTPSGAFMDEVNDILATDSEYRSLEAARRDAQKRVQTIQHEKDRQGGKDVGYWRGVGEVLSDTRTWDFGLGDMRDAMTKMTTAGKSAETRSASENIMLEQAYETQQAQSAYGQNDSFWNRAGVMTGEMLPFMLDFAIMGGAKGGTSMVTRNLDAVLLRGLHKAAPKVARNKAVQWTTKALGAMPEDLLYRAPLMTNTVQGMKTSADIIDRKLGDVVIRDDGTYDFSNDKTWGSAIWQGEANAIIENYSEMFGTHLEGVLSLKTVGKLADTFGAKRLSGILTKASNSELAGIAGTMQKHLNQLGVSDYFGEVGEEYYGQLWRTMLNLDDAYKPKVDKDGNPVFKLDKEGNLLLDEKGQPIQERENLFLDGQFHGDIWGGMALSMGLMGAGKYSISAAAYGSMKHRVNKTDTRASEIFTPEVWDGWRERIDGTTNDKIGEMAEAIITDTSLTPEQRDAAMNYMEASLNLRGFNLASVAHQRGGGLSEEEASANESYMEGYSASTPQERRGLKKEADLRLGVIAGAFGEDIAAEFEADPLGAISRSYDPELKHMGMDYYNARMALEGSYQSVRDDIDNRIAQSDVVFKQRMHKNTGMIHPAVLKAKDENGNDRHVYVVNGNLVAMADGSGIDRQKSDRDIIAVDESGKADFYTPADFSYSEEAVEAESLMEEARERIRQEVAGNAVNQYDGVLSFAPGETYTVLDNGGNEMDATVVGETVDESGTPVDGWVDMRFADGSVQSVPKDYIQKMADAADTRRVEQFDNERQAQNEVEAADIENAETVSGSAENVVTSQYGNRPEQNHDERTVARQADGSRVAADPAGSVEADRDRSDIRVYEEGLAASRDEHSEYGERARRNAEAERLIGIARKQGQYVERSEYDKLGEKHPKRTGESEVYIDKASGRVYKIKDPTAKSPMKGNVQPEDAIYEHLVHNKYFPETSYQFEGISDNNGDLRIILSQGYINAVDNATDGEIEAALAEKGLMPEGNYSYGNDEISVTDVTGDNALLGSDGKVYFIDPIIDFKRPVREIIVDDLATSPTEVTAEASATSALSRIPVDEKGEPVYEQADPGTAWDALLEETEDEQIAQNVIAQEIAEREDALKKLEKQKPKAGLSTREKIQAEKDKKRAMDGIRQSIDHWKRMAGIKQRRQAEEDAIRNLEIRKRAEEARVKAEQERAEREEAERIEREALNGVPDWSRDTPQGETRGPRSGGNAESGERESDSAEPADSGAGTSSDSRERDDVAQSPVVTTNAEEQESAIQAEEDALNSRIEVKDDDWTEGGGYTPTLKRTVVIDGIHNVTQVDAPNDKGDYTGSIFEYEGKTFGDLREVISYIDSSQPATIGERIAEAEAEVNTTPTDGQKKAGNYKKGHVQVGTFDVTIENPKGSKRSGTDPDGKKWETTMTHTYGYILGTKGVDGDHIDVYISSDIDGWNGRKVFVVDQYNPDGSFDEHKVMLGFNDKDEAFEAYLSNYEAGWDKGRRLNVTAVNLNDFEKWIESSKRKTKAFADYKNISKAVSASSQGSVADYKSIKSKEDNNIVGRPLSEQEASDLIARMEMSAEEDPKITLSPESWQNTFGLHNSIATPLGEVKMGEGQYQKFVDKKRSAEFGMAVMTLQDPDLILIEPSEAKDGHDLARPFSYVFVKTFIRDGQKIKYYTSVSVLIDGMEVSVSSHFANKTAIQKKLQEMERAYTKESLLPNSSEWHLAEHPTDVPDLLPTQEKSETSDRKDNTLSSDKQNEVKPFLSEKEYIDSELLREYQQISDKHLSFDEWTQSDDSTETFNKAANKGYPDYINSLASDGTLQAMFDSADVNGRIKIRKGIDAAGLDITELIDTSKKKQTTRTRKDSKRKAHMKEVMKAIGLTESDAKLHADTHSDIKGKNYTPRTEPAKEPSVSGEYLEGKVDDAFMNRNDKSQSREERMDGKWLNGKVYDASVKMLRDAGIEVVEVSGEEAQAMLEQKNTPVAGLPNRANEKQPSGSVLLSAKGDSSSNPNVPSEAVAKIVNNTQSAKTNIKKFDNNDFEISTSTLSETFRGLGKLLKLETKGASRYTILQTDGGHTVAIRLSDHAANGNNFIRDHAKRNLSIVIERRRFDAKESDIEFTEATIPMATFEARPADVVKAIVSGVEDVLSDRPFTLDSSLGNVIEHHGDNARFHIRTYHGTGAEFDRFDFRHIGSGEGAQAFGWGGYVTEVKGIGKSYATAIGGKGLMPKIEKISDNIRQVRQWLSKNGEYDKYARSASKHLKELRREYRAAEKAGDEKDMEFYRGLIELQEQSLIPENHASLILNKRAQIAEYQKELDGLNEELAKKRHLYTVRIPNDTGDNYLDWDGKIPEGIRSRIVLQATLEGVSIDFYGDRVTVAEYFSKMGEDAVGFQLYSALTRALGSDRMASELLSRAGLTGIKYAANYNSGGRADGKKNYVLFSEADMKITNHVQFMSDRNGNVYGWTVGGKVYLNRDAMNPETPIHEYTHLWDDALRKANPQLWTQGVELMKQTPLWNEIKDNPAYTAIRDNEDELASEVHSRLSGVEGARIIERLIAETGRNDAPLLEKAARISVLDRLQQWIKDAWTWVKDALTPWSEAETQTIDLNEFVNMPIGDLLNCRNPVDMAVDEEGTNKIEKLFDEAVAGDLRGKPVSIGTLTDEGREYLEKISGVSFKEEVSFVLNPSDLLHIYKRHFGANEKDGRNIPLRIEDIRNISNIITNPDKVVHAKEKDGQKRNMFFFLKETADGSYNLMEIYSDRKGNLTAKSYFKSKEGVSQRAMLLRESSTLTSVTDGATLFDGANLPKFFELSTGGKAESLERDGYGAYSDAEVSMENDPWSKAWGESIRTKRQQKQFAERERKRMRDRAKSLSSVLGIDIEVIEDASSLKGKKQRAKGWYDTKTGKITVVVGNHNSAADMEATILHEAVAHHGLRQLLGEHFDEFLDKVYEAADNGIKEQIDLLASRNGWNRRVATEEYLAGLAEETEFDRAEERVGGWFDKIKRFFIDMLFKAGFKHIKPGSIGDNELRYILWRSYQNLVNPGRYRAFEWEAEDVAMQYELRVGDYAPHTVPVTEQSVAEAGELYELNERFNRELQQQIDGSLEAGHVYEMGMPSKELLSTGIARLPIRLSASILNIKSNLDRHAYDLSAIKNLVNAIQKPWAIFSYGNQGKAQNLIIGIEDNGRQFLVGISINPTVKGRSLDINSIRNVFPKNNHEWVNWINEGKLLRVDGKNEIQTIIAKLRMNPVAFDYVDLDNAAKIVESFENPAISEQNNNTEGDDDIRYRAGKRPSVADDIASREYEKAVSSTFLHRLDEGWHDYLRSVKALQEAIGKQAGREIEDHENVYLHALHKSSVDRAALDKTQRELIDPLAKTVRKLLKSNKGMTQTDIERYMNCKHAHERNDFLARRDAQRKVDESLRPEYKGKAVDFATEYAKNREVDYSGLTAIFDSDNTGKSNSELEAEAAKAVADFEGAVGMEDVDELWRRMRALTSAALDKQYTSGLISRKVYDELKGRWQWYVPLRGFREGTAGDVYEYAGREWLPELPLGKKSADGRKSEAGDILATAMSMLNRAIVSGNKNAMKQKLLNLALKNETGLLSVSRQWYRKEPDNTWKPVYPPLNDSMSGEEVRMAIEAFDEQMEGLAKNGETMRGNEGLQLPMRQGEKHQTEEHAVRVCRNGVEYIVWVNGNPKMAQAVNGLLNYDAGNEVALEWIENLNRKISRNVTAFRPDFIARNFLRDMQNAMAIMHSRNGGEYVKRMEWNVKNMLSPVNVRGESKGRRDSIASLYFRYIHGTLDLTRDTDRLFDEFMRNGGETGYSQILQPKEFQKNIEKAIKGKNIATAALSGSVHCIEWANRGAENIVRFAAYKTSREMGKSILKSIEDAKEASVNFNRKGSGAMGNRLARSLYLFVNPAVQGVCQYLGAAAKSSTMRAWIAFHVSLGAVMPVISTIILRACLGGGDDDEETEGYFGLQPYLRRGNICIPLGSSEDWLTIPMTQEQSMFYGIGETLATHLLAGKGGKENLGAALLTELTKMQPIDFVDGKMVDFTSDESAGAILMRNSLPTAVSYFADAFLFDSDFTGRQISRSNEYNSHLPEWRKGHDDDLLLPLSKNLNELTGGGNSTKGIVDFNPSKWGYVISRPMGGLVETPVKIAKTVMACMGDKDYQAVKNYPIIGGLIKDAGVYSSRNRMLIEEVKWWENQKKTLEDMVRVSRAGGVFEEAQVISDMLNTGELNQLEFMKTKDADYGKQPLSVIKDLNRARWDAIASKDKLKQAGIEKKLVEYQKKFLRAMHSFECMTAEERRRMLQQDYWEDPDEQK